MIYTEASNIRLLKLNFNYVELLILLRYFFIIRMACFNILFSLCENQTLGGQESDDENLNSKVKKSEATTTSFKPNTAKRTSCESRPSKIKQRKSDFTKPAFNSNELSKNTQSSQTRSSISKDKKCSD